MTTFRDLGLRAEFVDALAAQGIDEAFPIQEATIADALAGRDVCGKARTGFFFAARCSTDFAGARFPAPPVAGGLVANCGLEA